MQSCLLVSEKGTETSSIEPSLSCFSFSLHPALALSSVADQHGCSGFEEATLSSSEGRLHLILYASFPFQCMILFLLSSLSRDEKPTSDRWMPSPPPSLLKIPFPKKSIMALVLHYWF